MSKSTNTITENKNIYIKTYGNKKPIIKFKIRSFLDFIGVSQPVEYFNNKKRMLFEEKVLILWKKYNLNVPDVLSKDDNSLHLSKINGETIAEILQNSFDIELIKKIFLDMDYRHTLALKNNEPKLCHIDSNLRNILYYNGLIYHIDFEMGREKESTSRWIQREISKLLVSLLSKNRINKKELILKCFLENYSHVNILDDLINDNLKDKIIKKNSYTLSNILYDVYDLMNINKKVEFKKIKKILIIYSARFGDILLSTPIIRALKEKWPDSDITYLTHPKRYEILENNSFISNVGYITKNKMSINDQYDLAFVINKEEENFVRQALKVSKEVISFRTGNFNLDNKLLYTRNYPSQHSLHSVDMRLSLVSLLEIVPSSKRLIYTVSEKEKMFAKTYLSDVLKLDNKFVIGIQSSSFHTKAFRNWSVNNFINLCKKINADYSNIHFLLLGSEDDLPNVEMISKNIDNSSIIAGKVSLRESSAIMNMLNLYVGVDTGPTHIIGTMNIPMVVLYHSFASSKLLMPLENNNVIHIDHPISEHGNDNSTMDDISVEYVYEFVNSLIKEKYENFISKK